MIPNDSFHSSLIESNLLNCPTCLRPYSVEADFRPHILNCGHSTCGSCINVHSQCGVCNQDYGSSSQRSCVNYNLRDVVEEMNKVAMEAKKFSVQCRKCSRWEDMDRCRICKTCAGEPAEEIEEENNDYEKMPLFVFCSSCAIDDHMEKAHIVTKYQTYKNVMRMRAASDNAHKNVNSIVELCESVWEESQRHVQEWRETVVKTLAIGTTDLSVRKCQQLAESCEDLGIGIYEAIDSELLPALRRFTSLVKTATNNLNSNIADGVYLNAPAALPVLGNGKSKEKGSSGKSVGGGESVDEVAKTTEIAPSGQLPGTPSSTRALKSAAAAGIEDYIVVTPNANDDGIVGNGATVSDDVQKETCAKGAKTTDGAVVKDKDASANKIKMPEGEVKDDDASNSGKGHFASCLGIHQRLDDMGDPDCDAEQEENQTQTSEAELEEVLHGGHDSEVEAAEQLDELLYGDDEVDEDENAAEVEEMLHRSYEDDFAVDAELVEKMFAAVGATQAMYEAFEEREEMMQEERIVAELLDGDDDVYNDLDGAPLGEEYDEANEPPPDQFFPDDD